MVVRFTKSVLKTITFGSNFKKHATIVFAANDMKIFLCALPNLKPIMKNIIAIIFFSLLSIQAFAQVSVGGQPLSSRAEFLQETELPSIRLVPPLAAEIEQQDVLAESEGRPPRYAVHIPVGLNTSNSGVWTDLKGGDRVWRLRLETPNALATTLLYDEFVIPQGGLVYIYNDDRSSLIGGFSSQNNKDGSTYATQLVYGDACTIEYFEPSEVRGQGVIQISQLGHAYRFVHPPNATDLSSERSDPCEVDINCSEGNNWQDEKHGVLGMSIAMNGGSSWCTASLVNNTSLDCTPYILSAMHCTESSNAGNFGQYVFYFNYEVSGCGSGSPTTNQSITGCVLRADSDDGGGNSGSDFALMEATSSIPAGYNAYFNGWNAQNSGSSSGVGIHHPDGDRKKISTYTSQLTSTGWGANNTHWRVNWSGTANGHGVTEGGSSGSPLFDNQGRIIGTLTGGGSYCSDVPNPAADAYGKVAYHWQSNPGDDLIDWLDPGNTGQLTLSGTYAPCTPANSYDAGISLVTDPSGSVCASSITPLVTLSNYGSTTLSSVTINYSVDGNAETPFSWTGSLASNQSITISLPSITVSSGSHTFSASTSNPNNQSDEDNGNDASTSSFSVVISDTYVTLVLNTDDYGSETTWELEQNGGGVIASGGPYEDFENIQVTEDLCVQSGECYTFTISDLYGDGICCYSGTQNQNYQDGNYSLGDADGISIWTGSEFADDETVSFCIPSSSGDCDTLYDPWASNATAVYIYENGGGGYVAGTNSWGDLAKAQEFASPQQNIDVAGVICWIAAKADEGASVTANLYDLDGSGTDLSGTINTAPGSILATGAIELARVDTSGFLTHIEFNTPAAVSSGYAVGLDFSGFGNDDAIGIVSNADGDASGNEFAWEQWSDGEWYTINQAWSSQMDGDFDLAIFPILCPTTVTSIEDLNQIFHLFPNPNSGNFAVINTAGLTGKINVYNAVGALVISELTYGQSVVNMDLTNEDSGVYLIQAITEKGIWSSRFVLAD